MDSTDLPTRNSFKAESLDLVPILVHPPSKLIFRMDSALLAGAWRMPLTSQINFSN
jgi:hypothetical protein